jgi:hypothetical protein
MTPHLQLIPATTTTTAGPQRSSRPPILTNPTSCQSCAQAPSIVRFCWVEREIGQGPWLVCLVHMPTYAYATGTGAAKRARSAGSTEHRAWRRTILNWALFLIRPRLEMFCKHSIILAVQGTYLYCIEVELDFVHPILTAST